MPTVAQIINRAARIAGVVGPGTNLSAEDQDWGVDLMNDMLHAWALDGMDLGHSTATANDTLFVDEAYVKGIKYSLAVEMAEEKGTDISNRAVAIAIEEQGRIRAALCDIDTLRMDDAIVHTAHTFNHTTGDS
jgi:hypothetical protein